MTSRVQAAKAPRAVPAVRRQVIGGAIGTGALNGATVVLNLALTLMLTRLLGATGYGAFAFAFAWAMLLSALAGLGLPPLVVRHVASAQQSGSWGILRGVLRWANTIVLGAGVAISLAAAGVGALLLRGDENLLVPFLAGLLLVVPVSLTAIRQSAMQGLGRVVLGRTPETVVAPGLFLLFAATIGVALGDSFSATGAVVLQAAATLIAFGLGIYLLARAMPHEARVAKAESDAGRWRRSAVPLALLAVMLMANAQVGTIVLGVLEGPDEAGVFAVAARVTAFVGFMLLAAGYPLMPALARLYSSGQHERMREVVTRSARAIFLLSLPLALVVFVFAGTILELFGPEFVAGSEAARILVAGEALKATVGLSGLVLVMTGHESDLTRGVALGGLVNVVLVIALVPFFGISGAAVAATTGVVVTQLLLMRRAQLRVGVSGAWFARSERPAAHVSDGSPGR